MSPARDSREARRIAEIERELKQVRKTMREVESGRRRMETAAPAPGIPLRPSFPPANRPAAAGREDAPAPIQGDLFPSTPRYQTTPSANPGPEAPAAQPLARYLSSGGFMGHPLRRDQRQQRSKAIFMLIVVALAVFVVWRLFFA